MPWEANIFRVHNRPQNLSLIVRTLFLFLKCSIDISLKRINFDDDFIIIRAFIRSSIFSHRDIHINEGKWSESSS